MIEYIVQACIATIGVATIWLLSCKHLKVMRWGFVASLVSQPFWFYTICSHKQWGMLVLTMVYVVMSIRGIRNHWKE